MAQKIKPKEITIVDEGGAFASFFRRFTGESSMYEFERISSLRKLLSNQRAKILHITKIKKPSSIYGLAKILGRDFKSVNDDVKLLEKFGFLKLISEKTGKRERLRPVLVADTIEIKFKI